MTADQKLHIILIATAVVGVAAYVGLLLVPAWKSYSRIWERLGAAFLSVYVLAACLAVGVAGAAGVVWAWDQLRIS
jgi:hypothetical protein